MAIVRRLKPAFDSHFRLLSCGCGGEAEYLEFDTGFWAVQCKSCGKRGLLRKVRHTAQVKWNEVERND